MKYGLMAIERYCMEFSITIERGLARRETYLRNELKKEKERVKFMMDFIVGLNNETIEFASDCLKRSHAKIADYHKQIADIKNYQPMDNMNGITDEMIKQAKDYPIENLIEVRRGIATCINHEERHSSMCCKNNFAYCFSCGFSGDAITVFMKISRCSFVEAVKSLVRGGRLICKNMY